MRILYFHQYFSLRSGSSGTRSYELAKRLVERGHSVQVVCAYHVGAGFRARTRVNRFYSEDKIDGISIIQIHAAYSNHDGLFKRSAIFMLSALAGIFLALRKDYDLLFATSTPLTIALPGIAAKLLRRKAFVFEVRDLWPELPEAMGVIRNRFLIGLLRKLERAAYRHADGLVGLSPGIVAGIRKQVGETKPIVQIPNAADLELFKAASKEPSETFCAVFTGAHGLANGLDALLDAAVVLRERKRDDIVLELIGDGKMKPALRQRCDKENLANCRFVDPMPKQQLAERLGEVDAGLMILADVPAFYQGTSPNKFFDYLAAGLPIVINYPGWMAELVQTNRCGVAVAPGQPEALADALCQLADDSRLKAQMGSHARALAENSFNREQLAKKFIHFLEQFDDESPTPPLENAP